jgi:hypothetical protein
MECPICLESIQEVDLSLLPCAHHFHGKCIDQWDKGSCPVCRNVYKNVEDDFFDELNIVEESQYDWYTNENEIFCDYSSSGSDEYEYENYILKQYIRKHPDNS